MLRLIESANWKRLMSFVAVVLVITIALEFFFRLSEDQSKFIELVDFLAIALIVLNFYFGFRSARDRKYFMRTHWAELLVLVPLLPFLRAFFAEDYLLFRILRASHFSTIMEDVNYAADIVKYRIS